MSDENKPAENAATAAPAAEATATSAVAAPTQEGNNTQTAVKPEVNTATSEPAKETGPSAGMKKEIFKLRAERREWRDERQEMREKLERLEKLVQEKTSDTPKPKEEPVNLFDDPEKRLAMEGEKIKTNVLTELQKMQAEQARAEKVKAEGQRTIEMLLEKPEINGDVEKLDEIDEIIMNDPRLSEVVKIAPELAGKEAYAIWAKDKGIDPETKAVKTNAVTAASAPASTTMTPKGRLTVEQIREMAAKLDYTAPDFKQKWEALMKETESL